MNQKPSIFIHDRYSKVEDEINHFADKAAPLEIDKTSGDVRRRLKKMLELHYIGQQKEKIR